MPESTEPKATICGKGSVACSAVAYLVNVAPLLGIGAVDVVPVSSDTGADTWEPSLKKRATELGVPIRGRVEDAGLGPRDILFSLQYDRIIRPAALGGARAYNLHFSLLPSYRGCYPGVWALRRGESRAGVTLHVLTAGIDDGDIVDSESIPLWPFLGAFDLYQLCHRLGFEVFRRNLARVVAGEEPHAPQPPTSEYFDRRSIDFSQTRVDDLGTLSVAEALGLLRSLRFEPRQLPTWRGRPVIDCQPVDATVDGDVEPGEPVTSSSTGAVIRCRDGLLWLSLAPAPGAR